MRLALYSLILLGSIILTLDLSKRVKEEITPEKPEPTKSIKLDADAQSSDPHQSLEKLMTQYKAAIEAAPDQAQPYLDRAEAYMSMRKLADALADTDQAVKLDANNIDALILRGYILFNMQQAEKAIADFSQVLELDHQHIRARMYRAFANLDGKNHQAALDDYLLILTLDTSLTDVHLSIARCYIGLEQKEQALKSLKTYLETTTDERGKAQANALLNSLKNPQPIKDSEPAAPAPTP